MVKAPFKRESMAAACQNSRTTILKEGDISLLGNETISMNRLLWWNW
jgi:hypothetical protein